MQGRVRPHGREPAAVPARRHPRLRLQDQPGRRDIVAAHLRRRRATPGLRRCAVAEEFQVRDIPGPGLKRAHLHLRARQPVQPLLLHATVERAAGEVEAERPVEGDAPRRVRHHDGRVVDAEAGIGAARPLPGGRGPVRREFQQLQRMPFRVAELEGRDPAGTLRQALQARAGDRRPSGLRRQAGMGGPHVRHDDRHVLEPAVGRRAAGRVRPARPREGDEFHLLPAQAEQPHLRPRARQADEAGEGLARALLDADLLEAERRAEEGGGRDRRGRGEAHPRDPPRHGRRSGHGHCTPRRLRKIA